MPKNEERAKIVRAMESDNFEKCCEEQGFTVCNNAEENKSKKKGNI